MNKMTNRHWVFFLQGRLGQRERERDLPEEEINLYKKETLMKERERSKRRVYIKRDREERRIL